jgi:predicted phage replisome organizer
MAKRYYWLKLKEDFFRNKLIKKFRQIAGGDTYVIIYLKMQLLSLQREGILVYEGYEKTFAKELALEIDEDYQNIEIVINMLEQAQVLIETNDNEYTLTTVGVMIGSESASAQRVREHREKKEKLIEAPYFNDMEINTLFKEFLQMRKKLKAVNSERAINIQLGKLKDLPTHVQKGMLENAIGNSWKSLYPLKDNNSKTESKHEPDWLDDVMNEL